MAANSITYVPFSSLHSIREVAAPVIMSDELRSMIRQVEAQYRASNSPTTILALKGRLERGLEIALKGDVLLNPIQPLLCQVRSSDGFSLYEVNLEEKTCNCPDSQKGYHCKHRVAAFLFTQALRMLNQKQLRQSPQPAPQDPQPSSKGLSREREAQILKELGFDAVPSPLTRSMPSVTATRLGNLYRKYLHGEDLAGKSYVVEIDEISQEVVTPHPAQSSHAKWCLWVKGLPVSFPKGILFGVVGEQDLVAIFGNVDLASLKGKALVIFPQPVLVAGQPKIAIRFRRAE